MSGLSLIATAGPLFFAERAEGAMWQSQIVVEVRDCPALKNRIFAARRALAIFDCAGSSTSQGTP